MKPLYLIFCLLLSSLLFAQAKNALYYNKEGWKYLEKRQSVQALASFKSAIAQNGEYKDALMGLAYAYLQRNSPEDAYDLFNSLIRKYPEDVKVRLGRAAALTETGHYEEALNDYKLVLDKKGEESEALYGVAYLYYRMGKNLSAKRSIKESLRVNPYHYDTLLLQAAINIDENHLDKAHKMIMKAINVRQEFPDAYVAYGKLLLHRYSREGRGALLNDAREEFNRAIAINPNDTESIKMIGIIELIAGNLTIARDYYRQALMHNQDDFSTLYNLGYCEELLSDFEQADSLYRKALKLEPGDTFLNSKMIQFILDNNYAFGNPRRIDFAKIHYAEYKKQRAQNLSDYALMHLRYAIRLNPMNEQARKELAAFYNISGFNRLYISELKVIQRLHPSNSNREALNVAVIKRRDDLYNREGYAIEMPQRDVARILAVEFIDQGNGFSMYDSGKVFSDNLTFALSQFGRVAVIQGGERVSMLENIPARAALPLVIEKSSTTNCDYIVYGFFKAGHNSLDAEYQIINNHTGAVYKTFTFHESGRDALNRINYRAAREISGAIPLKGQILSVKNSIALINFGSLDGIRTGAMLYFFQKGRGNIKGKKILLRVEESDTYLCRAKVTRERDNDLLLERTPIYELKRHRSRLLD